MSRSPWYFYARVEFEGTGVNVTYGQFLFYIIGFGLITWFLYKKWKELPSGDGDEIALQEADNAPDAIEIEERVESKKKHLENLKEKEQLLDEEIEITEDLIETEEDVSKTEETLDVLDQELEKTEDEK